jgi:hypothetical protein
LSFHFPRKANIQPPSELFQQLLRRLKPRSATGSALKLLRYILDIGANGGFLSFDLGHLAIQVGFDNAALSK